MANPKLGMKYSDAIKTATRHAKEGGNRIVASMANQVERHEGKKAAKEFIREAVSKGTEERKRGRQYF